MKNTKKYRIALLGIGAVGGFLGAKLAKAYENAAEVEIIFIARGENKKQIRQNGLRLISPEGGLFSHPHLVSDDPKEIGLIDLVICTVKTYDLAESIQQYQSCIGDDTVILPLENGIDATEKIKAALPAANIWQGCIYLNARLTAPGIVTKASNVHIVYLGSATVPAPTLQQVAGRLQYAGIDARVPNNIQETIWEKFTFISAIATVTSYVNAAINEVMGSEKYRELLHNLVLEVSALAKAKGIQLPDNMTEKVFEKAAAMPPSATSSMHSDFQNGKRTELEALTGYVTAQARLAGIATPVYDALYANLQQRRPLL